MVSRPSEGRSDFFAVELSDSDLYALFNLGGRTQRFLVGTAVNDGQAHHVVIERTGTPGARSTLFKNIRLRFLSGSRKRVFNYFFTRVKLC